MLELAILGLLKEEPLHGYDLRKRLRERFGLLAHLSFGSLYPALGRLESQGAVRGLAAAPTLSVDELLSSPGSLGGERAALVARRATAKAAAALGGHGTRARKVYEITPAGDALFEQLLGESDNDEDTRAFEARLLFARHLTPSARERLLERRRFLLADRLERARRRAGTGDYYERAVAQHNAEALAADLAFIEDLLAAERGAASSAPISAEADHGHAPSVRRDRATTTTGGITQ